MIHSPRTEKSEEKKNRTKEEKQKLKLENEELVKEYGWCIIDSHKQRIGNFKIEPPGTEATFEYLKNENLILAVCQVYSAVAATIPKWVTSNDE